ncbi:hypothetical protein Mal48_41020 [Thalassoglobus polymorphus]|uniref:Uncharacterized protein n=1 Tax=Thalassoglobus polymorphus TaxID=2527994 RepID=A0A517QT68_9PLAN|nr:hypothetical protein Mal48_41020 [Thalassoglobus polymorphus]
MILLRCFFFRLHHIHSHRLDHPSAIQTHAWEHAVKTGLGANRGVLSLSKESFGHNWSFLRRGKSAEPFRWLLMHEATQQVSVSEVFPDWLA